MLKPSLVVSLVAALVPLVAEGASTGVRPFVVLSGSNSAVEKAESLRITTRAQWESVWKEHSAHQEKSPQAEQVPVIDFSSCMVIAVFGGVQVNTGGLRVISTSENADEIVIRMEWLTYQTQERADRAAPFAFIVMPQSHKPIVLQVNTQSKSERADGLPPKWKDYHRFAALQK